MCHAAGVIVGNYRCSLSGMDLNRVWHEPSRKLHPPIWAAKQMLRSFMEEREVCVLKHTLNGQVLELHICLAILITQVTLFCDLHGHSNKCGIFTYGKCLACVGSPLWHCNHSPVLCVVDGHSSTSGT